ncbi:MAG: hypothetical protein WBV85_08055 [Solirubrobacteraceae bacterium]
MELARLSVCAFALAAVLLIGCSSASPRPLQTSAQAKEFIESVTRGGEIGGWQLAPGANDDASRAWSERQAIHDLGVTLRREGKNWACELTQNSVRLRRSFGQYTVGDRKSQALTAEALGAEGTKIETLFTDVLKLSIADLSTAQTTICPSY